MKAAELRQSILQAAVQGKLVPHNPQDEPASELLKRIQQEKARLVKEGILKKEKPLPPVAEDEIPYDLPEGWIWCHFSDIAQIESNLVSPTDYLDLLHIAPDNIVKGTGKLLPCKTVREDNIKSNNQRFYEGQIIYSKIRPALKKVVVAPFDGLCSADMYPIRTALNTDYVVFFMLSDFFTMQVLRNDTRVKMPKTNQDELLRVLVPVPPLKEQQRISQKVAELARLCDELETEEKKLDALETHFAEYLPKTILQAAVQGKLVPQNSHDGPASELLKRIQQEKAQLVKEGKLKKEKPLSPISEEEIPYDLPEGWVWCRLGEITNVIMGQSPKGDSVSICEDGMEFHQGKTSFTNKYLTLSIQKANAPTKIATANSVLLSVRAPVGAVNITERDICIGRGLCAFSTLSSMSPLFLFYFLKSMEQSFIEQATGTTFIAVTGEVVKKQLFPLPPFAEQQRIVEKVDELMAFCEKLKTACTVPIPLDKTDNIIPFPVAKKEEETLMAARGDVSQFSNEAMQAIDDLFAEDEE